MNAAFVAVGALTAVGAMLNWRWWPYVLQLRSASAAWWALVLAVSWSHQRMSTWPCTAVGALLQVPGAVGMLLLGLAVARTHGQAGMFSVLCGIIATAACLLFLAGVHLGLGVGGMERVAFDTLTVWTVVLGVVILRCAARAAPAKL